MIRHRALRARKRSGAIRRDSLDALFSHHIRARDGWTCQRCGKEYPVGSQGLHCAHILGRRKQSVRWDPDNACALCYGCHQWFHEHPLVFQEWARKKLGAVRYNRLLVRSQITAKEAGVDPLVMRAYLKARLQALQAGGTLNRKGWNIPPVTTRSVP